jgi:hypothetical protein
MTSRVFWRLVAGLAIVGLSATTAQAGGALGAATVNTFFVCQAINGANLGAVVSTLDFDDVVVDAAVNVGAAVLVCQQVNVKDSAGSFLTPPANATDLKCYSVNVQGPAAHQQVGLQDAFYPSTVETVRVFDPPRLLCGPTIQFAQ